MESHCLTRGCWSFRGWDFPDNNAFSVRQAHGLTMEAGQHLVANVKEGEIFLDATPGSEAALPHARVESPEPTFVEPESPATGSAAVPAGPASHASRARPGASRAALPSALDASWSKRIAQGDFQGVLAEAAQRGLAPDRPQATGR